MAVSTRSRTDAPSERERTEAPEIIVCESSPEKVVFIESGNTDGWIASDVSAELLP